MRIAALLALGAAFVATPALADTTVIHAGAVVVDADSAPALLASQSSLVKRPVIDLGEIRLIGFDKAVQADLETLLD